MVCGGGVESICTQLTELGVPIAPSTYYDHINREPSRAASCAMANSRSTSPRPTPPTTVFTGARKVWLTLNREGIEVAQMHRR